MLPRGRVFCAMWSIREPNETLSYGPGLTATQIVVKLRRSVCFVKRPQCNNVQAHHIKDPRYHMQNFAQKK